MRFGAFCPMPIPLGGDWTATEHARTAADAVAATRTGPFAVVTFTKSGSTITIHDYLGQNGNGSAFAPTITSTGTGAVSVVWDAWIDPLDPNGTAKLFPDVWAATGGFHGTTGGSVHVDITSRSRVDVLRRDEAGAPADGKVTLVAYGRMTRRAGHYGGSPDKEDSRTEGETPHAWTFYRMLTGALGDAYTEDFNSIVHCKKLAYARGQAGVTRAAERLSFNATPDTADERLELWGELQGVPFVPGSTRQEFRAANAAKFRLALGPTLQNEDAAIEKLLGDAFVRVWRQTGTDLATPPNITYWAGGTAGPSGYDLGGGAWLSERRNLVVEVQVPPGMSETDFLFLVNVQLFRLLDDMLPSTATFNWATDVTSGFLLDISQLDYGGLVP